MTSVSSGYIAELDDSVNDPLSRSPSSTDFLFENDQDDSKDSLTLENVLERVLTWNNDTGSQSGSAQGSLNTNEVDDKMKPMLSDSDFSSVSTRQKDLILPEEDSTGISFSNHALKRSTQSDSSVRFSTESSAYSDTSDSIYNKQHSVSLPNIASASAVGMSPIFPALSPPLSSFTSQERVNVGNFAMMNPMRQHVPSQAESVLLSLGFGDSGRCLPQRFMNSWYEKLAKAQAEQQEFLMQQQLKKAHFSNDQNVYFQYPKPSEVPKDIAQSKVTVKSKEGPILRYPTVPKLNLTTKLPSVTESKYKTSVKDTRLARLREYVESHAGMLKVGLGGVDRKRKNFSDSRQQSLPINLETLKEEEEVFPSREKLEVNQKSLLKDFLKDEGLSDSFTSFSDSDSSYDCKKRDQTMELDKAHDVNFVLKEANALEQTIDTTESSKTKKINPNFSSDSLEVANIMKPKKIEPAMVSIILQDVDGNIQMTSQVSVDQSDSTLLNIPLSPAISSPISPIPQSPVTVIEVGLDNQLDSLDIDDATPRLTEITDQQEEEPELNDLVDHISNEALDADCASLQFSTSPEDSPSPLPSPLNISPDLFVDFRSSPTANEDSSSGIQADDGSLTPLEKFQDCELHLEVVQDLGDEFYLVKEGRVQCVDVGCQYEPQPSDRIKYPLFKNKLLNVVSSDSDSLISDGQNSSCSLSISPRCSTSPPIHLHRARNRFFVKGAKYALSDSEILKSSSEWKQKFFESPALVLTNENGEDNDLDPDSDTNFNNRFKPIYSSIDSSIGSDDDQYLITKPRPRRCSRHKRSLIYSDKKESDFSNSDDSVFIQPRTRKLYKCDSVEQECQTDQKYIADSSSLSSSSSPSSHHSRYDQGIRMDRLILVDQNTQTIQGVSETSRTTVCEEIQTDMNTNSFQYVQIDEPSRTAEVFCQTDEPVQTTEVFCQTDEFVRIAEVFCQTDEFVRTAEAICQTPMPALLLSKETQTEDEDIHIVQNGLNEDIQTRFTSTANFRLKSQFDASSPISNGDGACLLCQDSFTTVSSSECSSFCETSSENESCDSSHQHYEKHQISQFPRKTWAQQIENEMPQSDEDYDIFKTFEETCSSPRDLPDNVIFKGHLDSQLHVEEDKTLTNSNMESRFGDSGEEVDSLCNYRYHTYIESSDFSVNKCRNHIDSPITSTQYMSQNWSSDSLPKSFRNHIDSTVPTVQCMSQNWSSGFSPKSQCVNQNEISEIQLESSENELDQISETLYSRDQIDIGSAETKLRTSTAGSQEVSEPGSLNTDYSYKSSEQYESDVIGLSGVMDDKDSKTSKNFMDHIHNRVSKRSFRSSRKHVDSGFYETPCNSSDDLNKRVSHVFHGTRTSETFRSTCENQVAENIAKKSEHRTADVSEVQLNISDGQNVNRVFEAQPNVFEDQPIGMSKASINKTREQTAKSASQTPSLMSKSQIKTISENKNVGNKSHHQDKISDTPYTLTRSPTQYIASDIPYRGHMYHTDNQVSQTRHSKDNINIWVSEAPYIIRPEPNSMLDQLKHSCSSRRRSYRRKSVKALASLFDNKQ